MNYAMSPVHLTALRYVSVMVYLSFPAEIDMIWRHGLHFAREVRAAERGRDGVFGLLLEGACAVM